MYKNVYLKVYLYEKKSFCAEKLGYYFLIIENKQWSNVRCLVHDNILLRVLFVFSLSLLSRNLLLYVIMSFHLFDWQTVGFCLYLESLKFDSVLLFIINIIFIDRKHLLPSVPSGELSSHSCIYYGIVADGGFREKRWQHRYDMGGLYLQSYRCLS